MDNNKQIVFFIKGFSYKLRYRRIEGFSDKSVGSVKLVEKIKYLYNKLDAKTQSEILNKNWLDE
jgi:hypothetical protein